MKLNDLLNHRVSYQVVVTFDLTSAQSSDYEKIRDALSADLKLEKFVYLSNEDGKGTRDLPYNTLAALWEKDSSERETRTYFEKKLRETFMRLGVNGKYFVVVAQNWSVGAEDF